MKNFWKKLLVLSVSVSLTFGTVTVYAEENEDAKETVKDSTGNSTTNETEQEATENTGEKTSVSRLTIAGVDIVSDNTVTGNTYPGVSYDPENNILTLDNADIEMEPINHDAFMSGNRQEIIYYADTTESAKQLTINIVGDNYVSYTRDLDAFAKEGSQAVVNLSGGDVVISGNGTLNITSAKGVNNGILSDSYGGDLIIDGNVQINITPTAVENPSGFAGIYLNQGFTMKSGELNILANIPG